MKACSFCQGAKYVKSPDARLWQQCPACDGTGEDLAGGLYFEFGSADIVVPASGNADNTTQILNGDFRLLFLKAQSTAAFTIQLLDAKTGTPFSNIQIHNTLLLGTAQNPAPVLTPYIFRQGGGIQAKLTDLSAAPNTVRLCFGGTLLT